MASVAASLCPPLLVQGRKPSSRNLQNLPFSPFRCTERQNQVSVLIKAAGGSSESSSSSTSLSIVETVQSVWEKPEDRYGVLGLGLAAIVTLWASSNLVNAVDKLPILPSTLEFIGILVSAWFTYRYLLFKPNREELIQMVNKTVSDILGQ